MSAEKKQSIRDAYALWRKNPQLNQDKLIAALETHRTYWSDLKAKAMHRSWMDKLAFYSGDHSIRDTSTRASRIKLRENHTNNSITRTLAVITQNLPITRVFAASSSVEDQTNAEHTEAYAKYLWRTKKLETKFMKWVKWTLMLGDAFVYRRYDPNLGGRMILDPSETQSGDPETRFWRGDVVVEVDDPFRYAVRPGIEEWDDMYDFIRSVPVNRQALEAKHGPIEAESAKAFDTLSGAVRTDDDIIMQHHYHHKPTDWFEEGFYASWSGKTLIKAREASACEVNLPAARLGFDKMPGRFWALSGMDQIMDLQEQLDKAASMIIEARNALLRPRVFIPNEAKVPGEAITDEPNKIIRWTGNAFGGPKFDFPNINLGQLIENKADLREALYRVQGLGAASRGEIPATIRTALALQLVLEQDRSQYSPFIKDLYQGILDTQQGNLEIAAEYFDEDDPRVVKIEGESPRTFHGGMVPSPLDAYLEDTNPLGWTAAGRIEQVGVLIDKGLVKDRNQAMEMLHLRSDDPAYATIKIGRKAAQEEIRLLNQGLDVPIGPEDDDAVHLDDHVKVPADTARWWKLPQAVRDAHEAHIARHKERLEASLAPPIDPAAAAAGAASPGAGGGPSIAETAAQVQPNVPGDNMERLLQK